MKEFLILETSPSKDYELLDSGEGEKLERYGDVVLSRPDPQALWPKFLGNEEWRKANARFTRSEKNARWDPAPEQARYGAGKKASATVMRSGWKINSGVPEEWAIELGGLKFWIKPTAFKHTGVFPEQVPNWNWMRNIIASASVSEKSASVSVLNLFGYTGGATLAAAQAGAKVCHVDGSKVAITWAKKNAEISGLADKPIRWILDDVRAFLKREVKRGHKYDGIIMDPPAFGHGPDGELWKIEDNLIELFSLCKNVLSDNPLFFLVNGYASGYSAIAYENNLELITKHFGGMIEIGELTIKEASGRLLPSGIFARWKA